MKYPHLNKMKLPHAFKKQIKPLYEYKLPRDEMKLVATVCAIAALKAVEDFPIEYTREEVEKFAYLGCENMLLNTKAQELTNNLDRFYDIVKQHYTESYLVKIADYKKDTNQHTKDKKRLNQFGWINAYNSLRKMMLREFEANYDMVI